jgi:hypothetical protein
LVKRTEGGVEIGLGFGFVIDEAALDPDIFEIRLNEKD